MKNDAGEMEMSVSDDSKRKAWLEHYQRLLNTEFDWDPNHLSDESPVEGPPIPITIDMVKNLILKGRRLRWYGHVEHSNGAVKTAFDIQIDGKRGPGRPKMT